MKQSDDEKTPTFSRVVTQPVYRFSRWLTLIAGLAAIVIMLLVTVDVLMRRFLNMPITGSFEISTSNSSDCLKFSLVAVPPPRRSPFKATAY